jgi:hypothetical protein
MNEVNKIWTLRKNIKVPTQTPPPEIKKFWPYPSEKNAKIKGCRCTQPLRNGFFKPSQKFSSIGGGGVYIKWNGPRETVACKNIFCFRQKTKALAFEEFILSENIHRKDSDWKSKVGVAFHYCFSEKRCSLLYKRHF